MAEQLVVPPGTMVPMPPEKIRVEATQFGVFTGRSGEIYHFNPDADDERYHHPIIDRVDLGEAKLRGLVDADEDGRGLRKKDLQVGVDRDDVGTLGAERVAQHAKTDHKVSPAPSNLDTRGSVAWADRERVEGDVHGRVDGTGIGIGDADAPPAAGTSAETPPTSAAAGTEAARTAGNGASAKPAAARGGGRGRQSGGGS